MGPDTGHVTGEATPLDFLSGGGEMGALMRRHDWTRSPLAPPAQWPQALRTAVRLILNTGHPMYIWWGRDLACLYNDAYRASIGPERHPGSLGQPARMVWAEILDIIGPQIDQVMSGGGPTWHVNHLVPITRHGRREDVYWTYSYSPIDDNRAPNGIGGVLVVCSETTAQIEAARELTRERDRLAALFEQAPIFMALLRAPDHRFELVNPGYVELIGGRPVVGRTVAEALPETAEQGYVTLLDEVVRTGVAYAQNEARYVRPAASGETAERYVDFVYQPIKDDEGRVTGTFVLGADVTARALANAALRQSELHQREAAEQLAASLVRERQAREDADAANRTKDEFLAMLSHELRNPLAPILTALELMRLRNPDASTNERAVIERQVRHLKRLIDDLLDVSRVTSGKIQLTRAHVELGQVVTRAIEIVEPLLEERRQHLHTDIPADGLAVHGDVTRLTQVLVNLLTNASRYGRDGGSIEVKAGREGDDVDVAVTDDGAGIHPDLLPRVFDLFTQAPRGSDRTEGGLGLGLAIVRSLVDLHRGSVTARSDGIGRGSTFTVRLPLAEYPLPARADVPSAGARETPAVRRHRILVVDDNHDAAHMLGQLLAIEGHAIETAGDAPTALRVAAEFRPSIALINLGLPVMDGYELAKHLRAIPGLEGLKLVAITGYGQDVDRRQTADAGFTRHLVKPISREEVLNAIRETVSDAEGG